MKKLLMISALLFCSFFLFAERNMEPLGITKSDIENFCKNAKLIEKSFMDFDPKSNSQNLNKTFNEYGILGTNSTKKVLTIMAYIRQTQNQNWSSPKNSPETKNNPKRKDFEGKIDSKEAKNNTRRKDFEGKIDSPEAKNNPRRKDFEDKIDSKEAKNNPKKRRVGVKRVKPIHPEDLKVLEENLPKAIKNMP